MESGSVTNPGGNPSRHRHSEVADLPDGLGRCREVVRSRVRLQGMEVNGKMASGHRNRIGRPDVSDERQGICDSV